MRFAFLHGAARISAALLGAPATALSLTIAITTVAPGPPDVRLLAAMLAVFPAMVAGACLAWWSRGSARAWAGCFGFSALALLLGHLGRG